jgi:methionyl-tRNA formyltransferase
MTDIIRVVFLGSRPLGRFALQILQEMNHVKVVGCVVKEPSLTSWWKEDPYYDCGLSYNSHEDLIDLDFDLGVSINYWKIIPNEIIQKPKFGFINLHHAYNLCLRGRDMNARAILNARKSNMWFHGTCLHYTDDGLDTGPIIANGACEITEFDTGWSLFQKVENVAKELLIEWLPRVTKSKIPAAFPEHGHPLYLKSKTDVDAKFIPCLEDCLIESFDIVRAYDFNNLFQPAYTIIDGKKVFLTTEILDGHKIALKIDSDKVIYFHKIQEW